MPRTRTLRLAAVAAAITIAAVLPGALPGTPSTASDRTEASAAKAAPPKIAAMLRQVDPTRLAQYDQTLVGFETRNTLSPQHNPIHGIGAARDYIYQQFQQFAAHSGGRMTVQLQSYIQPRVPGEMPRDVRITNVVATLRGTQSESAGRTYVVSGHYDSRCTHVFDAHCLAPGADDDASGVSLVLELARVMAGQQFDATIVFMAVAGEEQGLFGSTHFVQVAKAHHMDIEGMLDDDIVGTANGDDTHTIRLFSEGVPTDETPQEAAIRRAVGGENDSPARQLARYIKDVAENDQTDMHIQLIFRRDRFLRGGDQIPFLENGYRSAVRFTEIREDFTHQHQDVRVHHGHQYGDLLRFVDFDYLARVTKVNMAALASLADAPARPRGAQIVATRLTNTTTLVWRPNTESDLQGYEVVWRATDASLWEHSQFVGNVTRFTLPLSKDNYFFGVRALDSDGNRSPVSFPLPKF